MPFKQEEIESLLPLPSATFHILMALADEDRHGYAIIQDIASRTDGTLRMSAGTLIGLFNGCKSKVSSVRPANGLRPKTMMSAVGITGSRLSAWQSPKPKPAG
jgi:hypothetical protein